MKRICRESGRSFEITQADLDFYQSNAPSFGGKPFPIPVPTLAPELRLRRRLAFRNERKLYRRKSDFSGKEIISVFSPESPYRVYDQDEWWSDKWDGLEFGRDFDFSKTFAEQFKELTLAVPHISLATTRVENSYFSNFALNLRNCYLLFGATDDEDCLYGGFIIGCRDTLDGLCLLSCELCYEGVSSEGCYNCQFFKNCRQCTDCLLIEDCHACSNCLLCFGLYQKEYHILNQAVSREEYEQYRKELFPLTRERLAQLTRKFDELKQQLPHRGSHSYASEDCSGDAIYNCKNCHYAFDVSNCEDCRYLSCTPKSNNSYDVTFNAPDGVEFCYEVCSTTGAHSSMATFLGWYVTGAYYSMECHNCKNIFGCVGLKQAEYCIFNKQYSKEEYEKLVPKIIEHMQQTQEWGEYFPIELSYFGYNETLAQEYYPIEASEAKARGWKWREEVREERVDEPNTPPDECPSSSEGLVERVFHCQATGKPFKFNRAELNFYQKQGLPLPSLCPDERHRRRVALRNPRNLWQRRCDKTGDLIWTSYSPDRPEQICSEEAFRETMS